MLDRSRKFHRQIDYLNQDTLANLPIIIIGAGATGGWAALALAKMGITHIDIWDPDKFEIHNLPNQFCMEKHIGRPKVEAVAEMIREFDREVIITTHEDKFTGDIAPGAIVISAVDSMQSRQDIWEAVQHLPIRALIDPRMGLTEIEIYTVCLPDADNAKGYKEVLWPDTEVAPVRCTARATIFTAMNIAGIVCRNVAMIARGESEQVDFAITLSMASMALVAQDRKGQVLRLTQ